MDSAVARDAHFHQLQDALGKKGLSSLQKCTVAMRMLAYGCSADSLDENLLCTESTALAHTKRFCQNVIDIFEEEYPRGPTEQDIEQQLQFSAERGFPGCIGSLDCMHWMWEMCPYALKGQYAGKEKKPSIVLEAVADYWLWIWHFYFGAAGSNNDINILDSSPLVNRFILQQNICDHTYTVAGKQFEQLYYLVDGIYPQFSCFVPTISQPETPKEKYFAKQQEAARKDVERTFGVLQKRFHILKKPSQVWYAEDMLSVMKACVILHNMIVEDEWAVEGLENLPQEKTHVLTTTRVRNNGVRADEEQINVREFIARRHLIRSERNHVILKQALVDHLWEIKGKKKIV